MKVVVSMFAAARQFAGASTVELDFESPPTVAQVQQALVRSVPKLDPLMSRSVLAVDHEFASPEQVLSEGCEVALIPPVSGG